MALSVAQQKRRELVKQLTEKWNKYDSFFFFDFTGMDVSQMTELREKAKESGFEVKVVKNTLLRFVLKNLNYNVEELSSVLFGPTAVVAGGGDIVSAAKILKEFSKETSLRIKGGIVEGRPVKTDEILALAEIPSRDELVATLVSRIASPITSLLYTLSGLIRALVYAIKAIEEKKS